MLPSLSAIPYELFYRWGLYRVAWHMDGPLPTLATWQSEGLLPGTTALDIGCGAASNGLFLARRGYEVTAVDFAPTAVKLATRRAAREGLSLKARVCDVTRGDATLGTFDLLFDRECLQDLKAPAARRAYARVARSWLAPKGALVVASWLYRTEAERRRFFPTARLPADEIPSLFDDLTLEAREQQERRLYGVTGVHCVYRFRAPA